VESDFRSLVSDNWKKIHSAYSDHACIQFVDSLKQLKQKVVPWAHEKLQAQNRSLLRVKEDLKIQYETYSKGYFSAKLLASIKYLEEKKAKLLLDQEKD
jgi:hypothetical protein